MSNLNIFDKDDGDIMNEVMRANQPLQSKKLDDMPNDKDMKLFNLPENFGQKPNNPPIDINDPTNEGDEGKFAEWKENERKFYLHQTKLKSQIRIQQHRETPIDYFAKLCDVYQGNIQPGKDFLDSGFDEPYKSLENLKEIDLEAMKEELMIYINLEKEQEFKNYWLNTDKLIEFYIEKIKMGHTKEVDEYYIYKDGIDDTIEDKIRKLIGNKSVAELTELDTLIENNIVLPSFQMNVQYWNSIKKQINISKIKSYFKEIYQAFVQKHQLDRQMYDEFNGDNTEKIIPDGYRSPPVLEYSAEFDPITIVMEDYPKLLKQLRKKILSTQIETCQKISAQPLIPNTKNFYEYVRYSIEDEDWEDTCNAIYKQECERPMSEDEFPYNEDIPLPDDETANKIIKLKKPKFFNRVKKEVEWTKYNQSKIDPKNPLPKVVTGYKFNIFYPELINKKITPQYTVEKSAIPNHLIVKFHAGPPYKDVAFLVLNKEWEISEKMGMKSVFDRGILHFHYNFKKHRFK